MAPGGAGQRAHQLASGDEAVRRHDETADDIMTEVRFFGPDGLGVEQTEGDALRVEPRGGAHELAHPVVVHRHLKRARAPVRDTACRCRPERAR